MGKSMVSCRFSLQLIHRKDGWVDGWKQSFVLIITTFSILFLIPKLQSQPGLRSRHNSAVGPVSGASFEGKGDLQPWGPEMAGKIFLKPAQL